jgi:hypothetical protein
MHRMRPTHEIGAGRERHVDAEIVCDRPIARIPTVFEAHDARALVLERELRPTPARADPRV